VPFESFEETFKAVAARDVDYAVVPIENSLGGSIHTNFDLLLRCVDNIITSSLFSLNI
jgi:prephenate dehydratase